MRKFSSVLALGLVAAMLFPMSPAAAACPTGWGSKAEASDAHPDSPIVDVRAGRHACFDRMVVELDGAAPGYKVRYVKEFVRDGSGRTVDLRGAATLEIVMLGARAHDNNGNATYTPDSRRNMVDVSGFRTFRQAYWGGTFEGTTSIGMGLRGRLPFRVFFLDGPDDGARLVIDVAHSW